MCVYVPNVCACVFMWVGIRLYEWGSFDSQGLFMNTEFHRGKAIRWQFIPKLCCRCVFCITCMMEGNGTVGRAKKWLVGGIQGIVSPKTHQSDFQLIWEHQSLLAFCSTWGEKYQEDIFSSFLISKVSSL